MLTLPALDLTNAEVDALVPSLLRTEKNLCDTVAGAASDDSRDPAALALAVFRRLIAPLTEHLTRARRIVERDNERTRRVRGKDPK